jgi:hypothetical protein
MQEPLQHSNSWVAGEEPLGPTARGARDELWTAARVLGFRGTARGDVRKGKAGERPRGEALRRGYEERPRGEARGEAARQGSGRGKAEEMAQGRPRQGGGGPTDGFTEFVERGWCELVAAGWREIGTRLLREVVARLRGCRGCG